MFLLAVAIVLLHITCDVVSAKVCVPINQCPPLEELLIKKPIQPEALTLILSSTCGFDKLIHKVWCPNLEARGASDASPRKENLQSTVNLPVDECGRQVEEKIVGGTKTDIDEFPWMAVLKYKRNGSNELEAKCAGVLISNRYVLTAAHCITLAGKLESVVLGDYHILNETDCVVNPFGDEECAPPPIKLTPEDVKIHPGWKVDVPGSIYDDLALIRLSETVEFTDFVRPICLPKSGQVFTPGVNYTIAGWGLTQTGRRSDIKLKAQVPSTSRKFCSKAWRFDIRDGQMCALGRKKQDSCRGDSGGPLMSANPETGLWFASGIISFGAKGCETSRKPTGVPTIYTFLPNYIDWIMENMRP